MITPPEPGAPWPPAGLTEHFAQAQPEELVSLLKLVLADVKKLRDPGQKSVAGFELIRTAVRLGAAGNVLVSDIYSAQPDDRNIRALAVGAVKQSEPTDDVVLKVGRVVLNGDPLDTDRYYKVVLDQLKAGLTPAGQDWTVASDGGPRTEIRDSSRR